MHVLELERLAGLAFAASAFASSASLAAGIVVAAAGPLAENGRQR